MFDCIPNMPLLPVKKKETIVLYDFIDINHFVVFFHFEGEGERGKKSGHYLR